MIKKYYHKLKGDRKYFAIVFFILILILVSGVIFPILINSTEKNWKENLSGKIIEIEEETKKLFNQKEDRLLRKKNELKEELRELLQPESHSYGSLINLVTQQKYSGYSVEIAAPNGRLIAWNNIIAVPQNDIFPLSFPAGEAYFYRSDLITYLSVTDTLHLENDIFYFIVSLPVEKHYVLQNPYYEEKNFSRQLSEKFFTRFQISYNPYSAKPKDGRDYSFDLFNNQKSKIAVVQFIKPALDTELNSMRSTANEVQAFLVALGFIFLTLGFKNDYKSIRYKSLKLLLLIIFLAILRYIFYSIGFPAIFIEGALSDPANFSSAFGGGIVKSPIEFFISSLFVLIVSIQAVRYLIAYVKEHQRYNIWIAAVMLIPLSFLFLLLMRGLNASMKSVIFDSTIRYFKEPTIIPNFVSLVLNFNVLMLGAAVILLALCCLVFLLSFLHHQKKEKRRIIFFSLFILIQISGVLFIEFQRDPLITPFLSIIFITLIFLLCYQVYFNKLDSNYNFVYSALASSIITISLLIFFNLQLERESLKTTALELNRPNENLLNFLVYETLTSGVKDEDLINSFYRRKSNFDAAAFIIWSKSSLQRESINSSVVVFNKEMNRLGEFSIGIQPQVEFPSPSSQTDEIKIYEITGDDGNNKTFTGILPVTDRGIILGYLASAINFDMGNIKEGRIPEFLESKSSIFNSVIDVNDIKIFEIKDSRLTAVYGDVYPSRDQILPVANAAFKEGEQWLMLTFNNESYLVYALKTEADGSGKITAVALKAKQLTWNLFNFFKIFIVHSLFIIILFLVFFFLRIKEFKYTFRAQLLIAFLLISIIPVALLAAYNREIVSQRSGEAVFNELNERSNYLTNHIQSQLGKHPERDVKTAFDNAAKELGISFGVYDGTVQIYNSKEEFYEAGLFDYKINPEAHYRLTYLSYREFLIRERIENYSYDSFYKKVDINNRSYIIGVNDAFNKIQIPFSTIDVDIFLFGVYSFATLIIIILSTFLANRISSPVRRLMKAAEAVAQGDLSVQLENKERGEMKDLLEGFNSMTQELQRNQAELAELERETAWKEMAKQVAHEIKNPLTPMKLAVQQLIASYNDKKKNFNEIFEKVSTTILNQIESLNLIASEFSRFARMPSMNLEKFNLLSHLNETINLFIEEKAKIEIETKLIEADVEADKAQLRRMFINIIRNSIQAGADKVIITIEEINSSLKIVLKDNGSGIPPEYIEKIFEANFTTKEKGMGLGLKLAKRFLEGINGNIKLLASSEKGTTFEIVIPKAE